MTRYTQSVARLENAEELCELVMGRASGENAAGVTWMGDVWGLLNQAAGKIGTAVAMLRQEGGWDHEEPEPPPTRDAMEENRPPDFAGVSKSDAYEIGWLRAVAYLKGGGR